MSYTVRKYRVFLAMPEDLKAEQQHISKAVQDVNIGCRDLHCELELVYWKTHAAPASGPPEDAILRQVRLEEVDIVLGLLWTRFGTPTKEYESGFQEEIQKALRLHKKTGRPRIMLYFCETPPPLQAIDTEQLRKVREFKRWAKSAFYYATYEDSEDLKDQLRRHLRDALADLHGKELATDFANPSSKVAAELQAFMGTGAQTLRPFFLPEEARILNPDDQSWNVAFRADTLVSMFDNLASSIRQRELERNKTEDEAEALVRESLFNAGVTAADEFSGFLAEAWAQDSRGASALSIAEKLNDWAKFDSSVGFGKFESTTYGNENLGSIALQQNFLLHGRSPEDANLCSFMSGYISTILRALFGTDRVSVVHDLSSDCGQYQDDPTNTCVFHYRVDEG